MFFFFYIILYYITLYYIILYYIILYYMTLYYIILHYIILYCIILYYIILYHIILYFIFYYIILYHYICIYICILFKCISTIFLSCLSCFFWNIDPRTHISRIQATISCWFDAEIPKVWLHGGLYFFHSFIENCSDLDSYTDPNYRYDSIWYYTVLQQKVCYPNPKTPFPATRPSPPSPALNRLLLEARELRHGRAVLAMSDHRARHVAKA